MENKEHLEHIQDQIRKVSGLVCDVKTLTAQVLHLENKPPLYIEVSSDDIAIRVGRPRTYSFDYVPDVNYEKLLAHVQKLVLKYKKGQLNDKRAELESFGSIVTQFPPATVPHKKKAVKPTRSKKNGRK